jgi:hypothetical protein
MDKINKKLFDLNQVYMKFSHGEIWNNLIKLRNTRLAFNEIINETNDILEKKILKEQLIYVIKNIRTFEDALLCHETKFTEKRTSLGELGIFILN